MRIELRALSVKFGKVHALDHVSLTIEPGQIVSVLGTNGAGKTTLLRCLAAIVIPNGKIFFDDEEFHRGKIHLRRKMAFLPDSPVAFPQRTVLEHIGMVLRLYEKDRATVEPRVLELLRGFDILPFIDTPFQQLSRGQAYKTGLVALLAVDPELLMLDEPFASGMDPNGISLLKREARAAAGRGRIILYSTQILDIAEKLSDRLCVIDKGKLRYYAPLEELPSASAEGEGVLEAIFKQFRESTP